MTSERKIRSNRANARASTGPKTGAGRGRAARNALRHGLTLPVYADKALSKEVEDLADEIAGAGASAEMRVLARSVAEAQIDLRRVRNARHKLLSDSVNEPYYDSKASARMKMKMLLIATECTKTLVRFVTSTPQGPAKFATILAEEAKRLLALDRYERQARQRREAAIRELDFRRIEGRLLCNQ